MELWTEDWVMQAITSISEQGRHGRFPAFAIERADTHAKPRRAKRLHHCPRCGGAAVQSLGSTAQSGGTIAHHWECESCEFDWVTFFHALLV
jgi:hypothetical protein